MSALLCQYSSTSADASHAQRLQQALEQSKSETQTLLSKLHKLERQQVGRGGYVCVWGEREGGSVYIKGGRDTAFFQETCHPIIIDFYMVDRK